MAKKPMIKVNVVKMPKPNKRKMPMHRGKKPGSGISKKHIGN